MRQHAEKMAKEKNTVMKATNNEEILEVMFRKNLKGNLEPNMFGDKMEQLEKQEKAAYAKLKQRRNRSKNKNQSAAEKRLIERLKKFEEDSGIVGKSVPFGSTIADVEYSEG